MPVLLQLAVAVRLIIGRLADQQAFRVALREAHAERAVFEATVREVAVHAIDANGSSFTEMVMGLAGRNDDRLLEGSLSQAMLLVFILML